MLAAAPTAEQIAAANNQQLAGHEAAFATVFRFPNKLERMTLAQVQLHEVNANQLRRGDTADLVLIAGQQISIANPAANLPTVFLKAGCDSKIWLPQTALLLSQYNLIHLVYGVREPSEIKLGLEVLQRTATKNNVRNYLS